MDYWYLLMVHYVSVFIRGEHFRHAQNLKRSTTHLSRTASPSFNDPTLPFSEIFAYDKTTSDRELSDRDRERSRTDQPSSRAVIPGPRPPKSWSRLFGQEKDSERLASIWRLEALSFLYSHLSPSADTVQAYGSIPPLTQICFRVLLSVYPGDQFAEDLVPALPPHLRREILRWSAIHAPLPSSKLYALCEGGQADGELIVIGPQASLQREFLKEAAMSSRDRIDDDDDNIGPSEEQEDSWDSPAYAYMPPPLYNLALLAVALPVTTLFTFPPTLTHLALLALTESAPIHRLPRICPLIEMLDLSYNPWLNQSIARKAMLDDESEESTLRRVEWGRWTRLRILGLRECNVGEDILPIINKARWVDVEITGLQPRGKTHARNVDVGSLMDNTRLDD